MRFLLFVLVVFVSSLSVCSSTCNFNKRWGNGRWIVQNVFPNNKTLTLLTYRTEYGFTSYSYAPETETGRFTCDEFSTSGIHTYYVKKTNNGMDPEKVTCVDDIQTNNVILHQEVPHDASSDIPSIKECKKQLSKNNIYDVLLPDDRGHTGDFFPPSVNYSFSTLAYRVRYTNSDGKEECTHELDSTLVLSPSVISILTCKYKSYPKLPLTGLIYPVSHIQPQILGETDDSNGEILIMRWSSKTIANDRIFCVRYKTLSNQNMLMSFDLTSGEPGGMLRCRRGHRYDDVGQIEGREYFLLTLIYDDLLRSRSPVSVTKPVQTTKPTPESSTLSTTTNSVTDLRHVELALDINYNDIKLKKKFQDEVITVLANTMGTDKTRISNVKLSNGSVASESVMTFDLKEDLPSNSSAVQMLVDLVFSKGYSVQTSDYKVRVSRIYYWKDGPCPDVPCEDDKRCLSERSGWKCACIGDVCKTATSMESSKMNVTYIAIGAVVGLLVLAIIIAVVIFVVWRKNRDKDPDTDDSEMTYTNSNSKSLETLDRELYSTINQKPKAYHEKSFSSLDKDEDYGEKTGIHL